MRKIPALAIVKESYSSAFLNNAYFLKIGWQTFGLLVILSIISNTLETYGLTVETPLAIASFIIAIPYEIRCYQFSVDGTLAPSPNLTSIITSQPNYKRIYKSFLKYYLILIFLVVIAFITGIVVGIAGESVPTVLAGLALILASPVLWVALTFTLPASATGRSTSIMSSAKQLWGNYLRYAFVLLVSCIPSVALLAGTIAANMNLDGMIPPLALNIMVGVASCVPFMLSSTMLTIAVGASYREIVCTAKECAPTYETGTPIHPK